MYKSKSFDKLVTQCKKVHCVYTDTCQNKMNALHILIAILYEKIDNNNNLTLSECNEIYHLTSRDIYLIYI